jgi:hypothetical protein
MDHQGVLQRFSDWLSFLSPLFAHACRRKGKWSLPALFTGKVLKLLECRSSRNSGQGRRCAWECRSLRWAISFAGTGHAAHVAHACDFFYAGGNWTELE